MSPAPSLIALDWGTSSLRAYLMGAGGAVLESRTAPQGIMHVANGDFATVFEQVTGDWRRRWRGLRALAAGMIGSDQGWVQAPYIACPAGVEELAAGATAVPGAPLHIVPGVAQYGAAPNMMRGEETQIAGALAMRPGLARRARLVLPGTHSKWVAVEDGRIRGFDTVMTGEVFAVLREHSILGRYRAETPSPAAAKDAFARGVAAVRDGGGRGVAPLLFSARALVLARAMEPGASLDYLSGLLIGEELRCGLAEPADAIALIGDPALCARYRVAFELFGMATVETLGDTAPAGLWRIAEQAGLNGAAEGG